MRRASTSPFVFWNSLNVWQSCVALGAWAAHAVGTRMVVAAGFHEAGYGLLRAFSLGFHGAGGETLGVEVTHRDSAIEDPSATLERLAEREADFCCGLYSGREGVTFLEAYSRLGLAGRLPLVTTPLMLHDHWIGAMGDAALRIRTACSWVPGSDPDADSPFREATGADEEPGPDVFGLLGYETGLALRAASAAGPGATGSALADALGGVQIRSPRGPLAMDPEWRAFTTRDHLVGVEEREDGARHWTALGPLALPDAYESVAREVRMEELRHGWLNPYLVN